MHRDYDFWRTINAIASALALVGIAWMHSITFEKSRHSWTGLQLLVHYTWMICLAAYAVVNIAVVAGVSEVQQIFKWMFAVVVLAPVVRWWLDFKIGHEIIDEIKKEEVTRRNGH